MEATKEWAIFLISVESCSNDQQLYSFFEVINPLNKLLIHWVACENMLVIKDFLSSSP